MAAAHAWRLQVQAGSASGLEQEELSIADPSRWDCHRAQTRRTAGRRLQGRVGRAAARSTAWEGCLSAATRVEALHCQSLQHLPT